MNRSLHVVVHAVAQDGYPDMEVLTGRVAFIFDGCIVSGWPLTTGFRSSDGAPIYSGRWEANSDVGGPGRFEGVTHWVEFPVPFWELPK